jgi:hypothetical protein
MYLILRGTNLRNEKRDEESRKRSVEAVGRRASDIEIILSISPAFSVQPYLSISKAGSAHSLSEPLHDLLDKHATSAELRSLHHEGVKGFFSIGAYIDYALEVDDEFTASSLVCIVPACDPSQFVGPRRKDLTL